MILIDLFARSVTGIVKTILEFCRKRELSFSDSIAAVLILHRKLQGMETRDAVFNGGGG